MNHQDALRKESPSVFITRTVAEKFRELHADMGSATDVIHIDGIMDPREAALGQAETMVRHELEKALLGNSPALHSGPPINMADLEDRIKLAARIIQQQAVSTIIYHPLGNTTIQRELRNTLPTVMQALREAVMEYGKNSMNLTAAGYGLA